MLSDICDPGGMTEPVQLGNPRGRLHGHLAAALANHLVRLSGSDAPARRGDTFWHGAQSDFEVAHEALEAVGVFLPQGDAGAGAPHLFVVDAADMPDFLARSASLDDGAAARLREAFVRVACGYGGLSDGLDWFVSPPHWRMGMIHLAREGFALREGDLFRWTERIGPAMRSAYLWNEAGQSLGTLAQADFERDVELAWRTMPDTLREAIRSSRIGFIELVKVLALSWKGGEWRDFNRDERVELTGQVELARALLQRADAA